MRKNLIIATLLLLSVLGVTACSKGEDKSTDQTTQAAAALATPNNDNQTQPQQTSENMPAANPETAPAQPAVADTNDAANSPIAMSNDNVTQSTTTTTTTAPTPDNSLAPSSNTETSTTVTTTPTDSGTTTTVTPSTSDTTTGTSSTTTTTTNNPATGDSSTTVTTSPDVATPNSN